MGSSPAERGRAHDALVNAVLLAIGARPQVRVWRIESKQAYTPTGVPFRAVPEGTPDIEGVLAPTGRLLVIEIKTGKAVPSEQQRRRLAMYRAFGAVAGVARSVEQVVSAVEAALRGEWVPGDGLDL